MTKKMMLQMISSDDEGGELESEQHQAQENGVFRSLVVLFLGPVPAPPLTFSKAGMVVDQTRTWAAQWAPACRPLVPPLT